MTENSPFQSAVSSFLQPNPPKDIPEAPGVQQDASAGASPFSEPQDVDAIIRNLTLDRPLKLFIPNKEKYPQYEFHIINSIPGEVAAAHNKGFREVTDPEIVDLFKNLVAGTDKEGKAYRPILCARPKKVGEIVRRENRIMLRSLYAGMDPKNKDMSGKYTKNVGDKDGTEGQFTGAGFRVRA